MLTDYIINNPKSLELTKLTKKEAEQAITDYFNAYIKLKELTNKL